MTEELKPCPFCGVTPLQMLDGNVAHCSGCQPVDRWQNAYCWKEIDRLKKELADEKTLTDKDVEKDYTVRCIKCGSDRNLRMVPHRLEEKLVGWIFVCEEHSISVFGGFVMGEKALSAERLATLNLPEVRGLVGNALFMHDRICNDCDVNHFHYCDFIKAYHNYDALKKRLEEGKHEG